MIQNNYNFHYEIIESIIVKYQSIFNLKQKESIRIYLHIKPNQSFYIYIKGKYPNIIFKEIKDWNYFIDCTIYDKHFQTLRNDENACVKYIAHEITDRLKTNPNVYFLTPLSQRNYIYADVLPYSKFKNMSDIPTYVIQGNLNQGRRCF